jgi:hypothetical protein
MMPLKRPMQLHSASWVPPQKNVAKSIILIAIVIVSLLPEILPTIMR